MKTLAHGNDVLTFFLELTVYGSVLAWAWTTPLATWARIASAFGAVATMGILWGLFAAPKASMPLHGAALVAFEGAWFAVGVAALWASAGRQWSVIAAAVILASGVVRIAVA